MNDSLAAGPHIDKSTRSLLDIKMFHTSDMNDVRRNNVGGAITAVTQMTVSTIKLQRLKDLATCWRLE